MSGSIDFVVNTLFLIGFWGGVAKLVHMGYKKYTSREEVS